MTTSPTDKIDSADYREHYHRALAQTLSDEQMTAQGFRDLTQTLSDSEAQGAESDAHLHAVLL